MKDLKNILKESIFDDDIDVLGGVKEEINNFIKSNYHYDGDLIISDKYNKNGLYEVSTDGNIIVTNKNISSLTNDTFEWSEIIGQFNCRECKNIKSLEGAPKKVGDSFSCMDCNNLKSLKGAPEFIRGYFNCNNCGSEFTTGDVKKVSKVDGCIYI